MAGRRTSCARQWQYLGLQIQFLRGLEDIGLRLLLHLCGGKDHADLLYAQGRMGLDGVRDLLLVVWEDFEHRLGFGAGDCVV